MLLLAWKRRSASSGRLRATRDTLPFRAVGLLLAGAARALLASRWRFPGEALSRESLTQDSRSAVKARLFDPLRESFGEERCALRGAGVNDLERGHHVGLSASSREGTPLKAAPIVVCARTSLAVAPLVDDARSAMGARYGLTPRRVASSRLATHERREGLRAARTARWRRSPGRAQGDGGDACVSLQAPPPKVATQVSGGRDAPRRIDGDARTKHRVRARTPRRSHHLEVAPDVAILRQAQNRYVAKDAFASKTEATNHVAWSFLKNHALTSSVNAWPPLSGCLLTGRRKGDRH